MEDKKRMSRREFLKLASLAAGSGVLAACEAAAPAPPSTSATSAPAAPAAGATGGTGTTALQGPIPYPAGQIVEGARAPKLFNLDQMMVYKKLDKYTEPEYITKLVQAGKLPPVEQRQPETPDRKSV